MGKLLKKIGILSIFALVCFLLLEGVIRVGVFSNRFGIPYLKQSGLYAGYSEDDDYWKLYYQLEGEFKPPHLRAVHSLLGWSQVWVDKNNPLGLQKDALDLFSCDKTKVLFYGDSYVKGIVSSPDYEIPRYLTNCFQETAVIDLGCGGYALDQMFLLFTLTHKQTRNPYIIFGILVEDDLDRSILSVRTGQKPYFKVKNDKLLLQGIPIDSDPKHYFDTNPAQIKSYFFRFLFRGFSRRTHFLERRLSKIPEKLKVNSKIIDEIGAVCKKEGYPLLFVLFHANPLAAPTWQEIFLKNKLSQLRVACVDTRFFLFSYASEHKLKVEDFYVMEGIGRAHHNNLGNKVIADGLRKYLSEIYGLI